MRFLEFQTKINRRPVLDKALESEEVKRIKIERFNLFSSFSVVYRGEADVFDCKCMTGIILNSLRPVVVKTSSL